jgi:hypothetical protein
MPSDNDTNPQTDSTTRAAYGLPELRKAIRTRAEGIRKLMERAGLPKMCQSLLSISSRDHTVEIIEPRLSRKASQRDTDDRESAEQSANELMLQHTIDVCLSYFYEQVFSLGEPSLLGFSQKLFGTRTFPTYHKVELPARSAWVCDQFISARRLSNVVETLASEGCLQPEDDRHVSKLEKSVLRCLKDAVTDAIPADKAHLNVVRIFLREECEFLEGVQEKINERRPVTSDDAERLGDFLTLGSVKTVSNMESGATPWSFDLVFCPLFTPPPHYYPYPVQVRIARLLAAPVAFEICRELSGLSQDRNRKPYIQMCHAPACQKLFFTSRANAKVCESTVPGKTSPCKLEWDRFLRWLRKCGHNVDTRWNDAGLIKRFIKLG